MAVEQQIKDVLKRIDALNRQQVLLQDTINVLKNEVNALALKVAPTDIREGGHSVHTDTYKGVHIGTHTDVHTPDDLATNQVVETLNGAAAIVENDAKTIENEAESLENKANSFKNNAKNDIREVFSKPLETPQYSPPFEIKESLEAFIGENLASKVGIIITVLGIGIGVKYAIDHDLIGYWGRIILGYFAGCGLLEVAFKLRQKDEKYEELSNVILSGGFASVFFVTYAAYAFYALMPQSVAFGIMVLVAAVTVASALKYNRQLIAVGGLVGAYAIPFLLSTGEDQPIILFTYIAIVNIGILVISFKRDWPILYYLAFVITWWLFISWLNKGYNYGRPQIAATYLTLFFALFYTVFIAYKWLKNEAFSVGQMLVLCFNSFFFYLLGIIILESNRFGVNYWSLFTLFNAFIHLAISIASYRRNLADRSLFNLLSSFVVLFVTIAIGLRFDNCLVTILWAATMVITYWIGRVKVLPVYANASYFLWFLTVCSLINDWESINYLNWMHYANETPIPSILNIYCLTTALVIAAFGGIWAIHSNDKYALYMHGNKVDNTLATHFLAAIITLLSYCLFYNEISNYFSWQYDNSLRDTVIDYNIDRLRIVWLINYSLLFVTVLNLINLKRYKNFNFALITSLLSVLTLFLFLTQGLYTLGALKNAYLYHEQAEYFTRSLNSGLLLRYISYVLAGILLFILRDTKNTFLNDNKDFLNAFDILLNVVLLWILSSEMVHLLGLSGYTQTYKWAISVLFGVYALGLIAYGINKHKKHLRIAAIVLFTSTLIKVFVFDLMGLDTIHKTIVMISLGVLLLIVSFLYTKFKDVLFTDEV